MAHYIKKNIKGIISIIDTIINKDYIDIVECKKNAKLKKNTRVGKQDKAKHPELLKPNLYFFQPCPEDSQSPLFARQYERVSFKEKNKIVEEQYHRVHPLTRAGLDLEHYKWLKWDIYGNIKFVDYPDENFHGKDYWDVPYLRKDSERASEERYIGQYEKYISKYTCNDYKPEKAFSAPYERELKYTFNGGLREFKKMLASIKGKMKDEGFPAVWCSAVEQKDHYFDDHLFSLYQHGVSFRLRKKEDSARITLKKKFQPLVDEKQSNLYLRMEEEATISKKQEADLFNGYRINPFPYRLISYFVPECGALSCCLEVQNKRTLGILTYSGLQKVEVCHDIVYYEVEGEVFGPEFEIEIESKGVDPTIIDILASIMEDDFKLKPSSGTKYERGVSFILSKKN